MKFLHTRHITVTLELDEHEANVLYDIMGNVGGESLAYTIYEQLECAGITGTGRDVDESKMKLGHVLELKFLPLPKVEGE